jgi:hypothetical protein
MINSLSAGLISALPLAVIFGIYLLLRGKPLVVFFQAQDASIARIPEQTLFWVILTGFIGAAFLFGAIAGFIHAQLGMPRYQLLAFGATIIFCILAVISRQPLTGDKIAWNLAVGLVLGTLVPLLSGKIF